MYWLSRFNGKGKPCTWQSGTAVRSAANSPQRSATNCPKTCGSIKKYQKYRLFVRDFWEMCSATTKITDLQIKRIG